MKDLDKEALISHVQQQLFPLHPVVHVLEQILMLLPRTFHVVSVIPEDDIKVIDNKKGEFEAKTTHPCFAMIFDPTKLGGWYYLECALVRHGGNRNAKIYLDLGNGYNEEDTIFIPSNLRGSVREVIFLPDGVKGLKWSPMEARGRFSQSHLIVHKITALESYCRRFWRVGEDILRFRHKFNHQGNYPSWRQAIFDIDQAYAWTADSRRCVTTEIDYETFIIHNDTLTLTDYLAMGNHIDSLHYRPVFSVVMPVYNPPLSFFREAVDSVIAQCYPYWELCLADDASTNPEVRDIINEYLRKDSRIKAVFREINGHISAASNSALNLACGEFIALLDQDDVLPRHALYHVAVEVNRHPDVCLIYTDEDKIDEYGSRLGPYFKPDWNPDLFYSQNLVSHLGVYRTALVRQLGGFRLGYEGSQDYDLALRVVSYIPADAIRHIPRVLYHWRIHADSTAAVGSNNKSYAYQTAQKSLAEHLAKYGATVNSGPHVGGYRISHGIPDPAPLVSLIIPTKDRVDLLSICINSILKKTIYQRFEIIVVDNNSQQVETHEYLTSITKDRRIRVLPYQSEFNFSAINNFAVRHALGGIIGLINNDVEVIEPFWLGEMVSHALRPGIGAVGAKLLYPDGRIQHAGVLLGIGGLADHAHRFVDGNSPGYFGSAALTRAYSAVTAACLIVRKSLYEEVGGLDEVNLAVSFNDVDFCLRLMKLGYRNLYTPFALLYHHESISRGNADTREKRDLLNSEINYMRRQWDQLLKADPHYNPNLNTMSGDFSLATIKVTSSHHGYPLNVDNLLSQSLSKSATNQ